MDQKRNKHITINLYDAEYKAIEKLAAADRRKIADYIYIKLIDYLSLDIAQLLKVSEAELKKVDANDIKAV